MNNWLCFILVGWHAPSIFLLETLPLLHETIVFSDFAKQQLLKGAYHNKLVVAFRFAKERLDEEGNQKGGLKHVS
ncbi:hypothetical protein ACJX0J_024182, partial [Zea mays]